MKIKNLPLLLLFTFISINSFAKKQKHLNYIPADSSNVSISTWEKINKTKIILTQSSFLNWNAGGNNSISGILNLHLIRNYKQENLFWNNQLKTIYGLNKEEAQSLKKTQDVLQFDSTFGYRENKNSNWYYSAKLNFKTQYTNGYKYPNTQKAISKFFSPAYLFLGIGAEYSIPKEHFRVYLSPITNKSTFVYNQTLANEGAFGVNKAVYNSEGVLIKEGENSKMEFGTLITGEWKAFLMKNIQMEQKVSLYSDYLNKYGNIDINWEVNFEMIINKYIQASLEVNLLYDDDTKYKEDIDNDGKLDILGARVQLKQLLGIGFSYQF